MKTSAMQLRWWQRSLIAGCRRIVLLLAIALFSTVHLLAATPDEEHFDGFRVQEADCASEASQDLQATAESSEPSGSFDASPSQIAYESGGADHSLRSYSPPILGSKRYWQPGANAPPTHTTTV